MRVEYDDLTVKAPSNAPGRGNPYPIEVTLEYGAIFTHQDSVPSILPPVKLLGYNGIALTGYLRAKTSEYLDITFERIDNPGQKLELGGRRIYRGAIRKLEFMIPKGTRR